VWTRRIFFFTLLALSLALTLASGFYAMSRLFTILVASFALSWVWARYSLRGITAIAEGQTTLAQVGDTLEQRVTVRNASNLPQAWVHIEDMGAVPDLPSHVAGLAPKAYRSWTLATKSSRRGRFTWGPLRVSSGDPLGLFRTEAVVGEARSVTVYPAPVPLEDFVLSTSDQAGDAPEYRGTSQITPNVVSVRRYVIGDSLNSIHWKSSAKLGRLMVKEFETEVHGDLWLILDLNRDVQVGDPEDGTEEMGVTIVASLARFLLGYDNGVGFLASGDAEYVSTPALGDRQLWRILESLATCQARGDRPLSSFLAAQAPRFTGQTGLIIVTPSVEDAVAAGTYLVERNAPGAIILMDPTSYSASPSGSSSLGNLVATGVAVYVVRKGDELGRSLSFTSMGSMAARPGANRSFATPGRWGG
jgi:uncharacterized protein (DUF58 family)